MRLLITRNLPPRVMEAARARFDVTLREGIDDPTPDELVSMLREYEVILCAIGDAFEAGVFAAAAGARTRLLANFGVGYEHIDVAAARAAGIAVTNTPGAVTDATADLAVSLILMAARRLGEGERLVRAGKWHGWRPDQMLGAQVSGKRVGLIGMGKIGRAIAQRCHYGFGMDVVFYNRSPVADPGVPARQVGFSAGMKADFVVIAVAGGSETRHLIDAAALSLMQPQGILVNVSRGTVIDENALIAALQQGQIRAAGLDVYEFEPEVPEALRRMENAVLLPHLGTACIEAREEMGFLALENVIAYAEGRPLKTPV